MFQKAQRKQVKLKLGISGPSGSGKTYSALRIAKGLLPLGAKIALIDTENRSASLYADVQDMPSFDTAELEPPYTVDKYIAAIEQAIKQKYDLLIVDSVSHVWSGEGGLLQEKEIMDARGGNSFTNWAKMTPKWNKFVSTILHSDIHMICTMRSKQEHALTQNDKGKSEVKKMGMAPQVREGFEYELTAVFDMDMTHHAQASKDRTNIFDGKTWKPNEKTGEEILKWMSTGAPSQTRSSQPSTTGSPVSGSLSADPSQPSSASAAPQVNSPTSAAAAPDMSAAKGVAASPADWKATKEDLTRLTQLGNEKGWSGPDLSAYMEQRFQKTKLSLFTKEEYDQLCGIIRSRSAKEAKESWQMYVESEKLRTEDPNWDDMGSRVGT
jgi:nucleoside-triphosphatase THEP1